MIMDFLLDLFLFLFPAAMVSRELKLKPKTLAQLKPVLAMLGFKRMPLKEFVRQTTLLFVALVLLALSLSFLFSIFQVNDLEQVTKSIGTIAQISPLILAYLLVVRVLAEEVFFRGFLVNRLGVLPSTILFALVHSLYYSIAEIAGAFFLGLVLAIGFKKKQCLFPVIAAHMLYNIFALSFILGVVRFG